MRTDEETRAVDPELVDRFSQRILRMLNDSAMMLMTSLGHRTGLFDTMAGMGWATPREIALRAGLNERYVREWLAAMVTGGFVELATETGACRLPPEHAAVLTRAASPNNLAVEAQFIGVLAGVEDRIVDCFRSGGGVPYSAFRRFHEVMAEESAQTVVAGLHDHILPLVDGLADRLEAGIDVLDLGCGSGRALTELALAFPRSRFTGYDLCGEAVERARALADAGGARNARFDCRDVTRLDEERRYDLVTAFDAIHDQADPAGVLSGIRTALRPGGTFLMQDIRASSQLERNLDHPLGPFLYTISCMHCMTVSLAQGGAGLGTCWGCERAMDMLRAAGFVDVCVHHLEHDIINCYYVARP